MTSPSSSFSAAPSASDGVSCHDCQGQLLQDGFDRLFNAVAAPVAIKDAHHRWCFLNRAYGELLGLTPANLVGQSEADIFPAAVAEAFLAAEQRVLETGEQQSIQVLLPAPEADPRVLIVEVAPVLTVAEPDPLLMVTLQDITVQEQVEQTLRRQAEQERLLGSIAQHLLQSMNPEELLQTTVNEVRRFLKVDWVLFYSFDPNYRGGVAESATASMPANRCGSFDTLNLIAEDLIHTCRGEIQVIDDVHTARIPSLYRQRLTQAEVQAGLIVPIVQGESLYGLVCALHRSGPRPWQDWEIEALREVATQVGSAIKQTRLYTQVQHLNSDLEQQVAQRTAQLQTALDFEATLKRITDRVRDSLDVNQIMLTAVEELTEALGAKGSNTALYDLDQRTSTIYYEYNSYNSPIPAYQGRVAHMAAFPEVYDQLLNGQYFQFCSMEPNPDRGDVAMLVCPILDDRGVLGDLWLINGCDYGYRDIEIRLVQQVTNQCAIAIRQARLYEAAQSQVAELERINTLKDDFLSTVSHELRTPVTSMRVALQLLGATLTQECNLAEELHKPKAEQTRIARYYHILQEECEREISLINDLLDLQRLDGGNHPIQTESIVLKTWLPNWVESFITRAKSRDQTLTLSTAPTLPVVHTDLASLERILAELLTNACKYTPPGEHIQIRVEPVSDAPQSQVQFVIVNTGVSIPEAELSHIFDQFYRVLSTDPWKQGGTGLGLALVRKLSRHLGGDVTVMSTAHSTCFTVTLPAQFALNRP